MMDLGTSKVYKVTIVIYMDWTMYNGILQECWDECNVWLSGNESREQSFFMAETCHMHGVFVYGYGVKTPSVP